MNATETFKKLKPILPVILILFIIICYAHYFIYMVVVRSTEVVYYKYLLATILIVGILSIPVGFFVSKSHFKKLKFLTWWGYIWLGSFNILFLFSLIETIVAAFSIHTNSIWVLIASVIIIIYSLYNGLKDPTLVVHQLKSEKLKGLKLVQISDLHIGMLHLNEKWLLKIVNRINKLNPDLLVITGDLVEAEFSQVTPQLGVLNQLQKHYPKFFITGNHEYINGPLSPWEQQLESLGFESLHNNNEIITFNNAKILMAGVPDKMIGRFIKNKNSNPDMALHTNIDVDYKILLAHQPTSVWDIKIEKCNLILTGHTHGGQIFPFHLLVRLVQPVVSGFKTVNGFNVFAHQGTGFWGPPMRWFSQSEIVLIHWV